MITAGLGIKRNQRVVINIYAVKSSKIASRSSFLKGRLNSSVPRLSLRLVNI